MSVEKQSLDLQAPTLNMDSRQLTIKFKEMTIHDRIKLNNDGQVNYTIPASWINENVGRVIYITYAVGNDRGERYQFSQVLRVVVPD
ncbi:hypothetical protein B1R44_06970 [Serratia marcescens]|nr:hypothetical protein B1R44_06970 [Serratia marcescens]